MDASWTEMLVIAYVAAGLRTACDDLICVMHPQTPSQTKSALFLRAMQAGVPASCHSVFMFGVWLSVILLSIVKWPYNLALVLWEASGTVLSDVDLHRRMRAWDAYEEVLMHVDPATEETRQMPVVKDPPP